MYLRLLSFCGLILRRHVANFFDEFAELFAFARAHVEEADAHGVLIMDCLHNASETEGQSFKVKFSFNARVDADREALVATDAAAANADIDDSADEARTDFYQDDGG